MLSPEEEDRILEEAMSRGWLSRTSVQPPAATLDSEDVAATPHWGPRIDRLIARGDLEASVIEQLRRLSPEGATPAFPADFTSSGSGFPVANWDRYELVRLLGEGGMGVVYEARDLRLNRPVALKFIRGERQAGTRRFVQEARAQARIEHDNVCKVYEVGEVDGRAYIAMELIQGIPLSQAQAELRLEERIRVLTDVAAATHAAHRIGIIHREQLMSSLTVEK